MFDFEKLDIYGEIKQLTTLVFTFIDENPQLDSLISKKLKESTINLLFEFTEAIGRLNKMDKKNLLISSRGQVFRSVSLIDLLKNTGSLTEDNYENLYVRYETVSKMLLGMIRSFEK